MKDCRLNILDFSSAHKLCAGLILGICVGFGIWNLGIVHTWADIIHLKNGSSIEGLIISETKTSITVELPHGTVTIKRNQILEINKTGKGVEVEPEAEEPLLEVNTPKSGVITPTIETSSPISRTLKDRPLVLSDESKKPVQKEINALLRKLVGLKDNENPWDAAEKLVVKSKDESEYLLSLLNSVQNNTARKWLIYTIGQLQSKASVKIFYDLLKTEQDESIRIALIEALGQMKEISTVDLMRKLLVTEKPNAIKEAIVRMLTRAKDVDSLPVLVEMLSVEDEGFRRICASAIVDIYNNGDPKLTGEINLVELLKRKSISSDVNTKKGVVGILAQLKSKETTEFLIGLLTDENAEIRSAAIIALSSLRDDRVVEILVSRLGEEKDLWSKMQIIQALGMTKNEAMVPILIEQLQDQEGKVRLCAARALGALTNKYLNDNYESWKEWWEIKQGLREPASSE